VVPDDKSMRSYVLFFQRTTGKLKGAITLAAMEMVVMLPSRPFVERTERRMSLGGDYLVTW